MAQEPTTVQELQHLIRELGREMSENMPEDLGFLLLVYHKGDGAVGWTGRVTGEQMSKARAVVRDWLDRAEKMESVHAN